MVPDSKFVDRYLEAKTASEPSYPFGPDARVYKVLDKMFALVALREGKLCVSLKGEPSDLEVLVSQFKGITPGYHLNKKHWVTVSLESDVPEALLIDLMDRSYNIVVSKMTKAHRNRLALLESGAD
ncbi:MmcQ/YjbR family DNA-binding protein [Parasalinivibrio latis]|uniref:MmcQ/YjbR family DNA-binding protein n=1 Tax=Parasalinivibrio latis TaxID=2952610 RepID=UPI0030E0B31B